MLKKGQTIFEYDNKGQMVGTNKIWYTTKEFAHTSRGELKFKLNPNEDGSLTQMYKRGVKASKYFIETEKTQRDYIVMALRAKIINFIEGTNDLKFLQKLYVQIKEKGEAQVEKKHGEADKANELSGTSTDTGTNNQKSE